MTKRRIIAYGDGFENDSKDTQKGNKIGGDVKKGISG